MTSMTSNRFRRAALAVLAVTVLPLGVTACSNDGGDTSSDSKSSKEPEQRDTAKGGEKQRADSPFGAGCASVPETGKGSFDGMAQDPVATAASHNPELSTLVTAVKKAGLVDTLNSAEDITVFAPTNDAFAKIPEADLKAVLADKEKLTEILTYHVVPRKLAGADLADGSYTTLQKSRLSTAGSDESYAVNDASKVVCGDVPTANATVHLVDTVLMPE